MWPYALPLHKPFISGKALTDHVFANTDVKGCGFPGEEAGKRWPMHLANPKSYENKKMGMERSIVSFNKRKRRSILKFHTLPFHPVFKGNLLTQRKGGPHMKKPCTVVWLLLVVAMLPIVAFAQSQKNQNENLSQFKTRLKQEQEKSSFLDEWNDENMDLFASIVKDSGIVIENIDPDKYYDGEWLTPLSCTSKCI